MDWNTAPAVGGGHKGGKVVPGKFVRRDATGAECATCGPRSRPGVASGLGLLVDAEHS